MDNQNKYNISVLLLRLIEDNLNDKEIDYLKKWLSSGPDAKAEYLEFIEDYTVIKTRIESEPAIKLSGEIFLEDDFDQALCHGSKVDVDSNTSLRGVDIDEFMANANKADADDSDKAGDYLEILELVRTSPDVEIEKPKPVEPERELIQKVVHPPREKRKLTKFQKFQLAFAACFLGFMIYVANAPQPVHPPIIAYLDDSIDAVWDDELTQPDEYGEMIQNRYRLTKGYASILFNSGAKVTVEAPADLSLNSIADMELFNGKIYATVPPRAKGFSVIAGDSKVVDLGTEFGVEMDIRGNFQLHVTKGRTVLFTGLLGDKITEAKVNAGMAKKVYNDGFVKDIDVAEEKFARSIDSRNDTIWKGQTIIASAALNTVTNPSFENGDSGWSSSMGGIKTTATDRAFNYAAPDGAKVIFAYGNNHSTYQVLSETLSANTRYTLQMDFCVRSDNKEGVLNSMLVLGFGGGGPDSGTILKKIQTGDPQAKIPAKGTYETWTLVFETSDKPAGLGEKLWIQLGADGTPDIGSSGYDNVRLYALPVLGKQAR